MMTIKVPDFTSHIIKYSLKIPQIWAAAYHPVSYNDKTIFALDAALMELNYKLSPSSLYYLLCLPHEYSLLLTQTILETCRELKGAHVEHNVYFKDFPKNIPLTGEFWWECIRDALEKGIELEFPIINLLDLPLYGKYLHSYEEMKEVHEKFLPLFERKYTIISLGEVYEEEVKKIYISLSSSPIPLSPEERNLLFLLGEHFKGEVFSAIPIRENKAIINRARFYSGISLLIDTPLDILRMCGDETLEKNVLFKSPTRPQRYMLMHSLNKVLSEDPIHYEDVKLHMGKWKRLGEKIHPHEYSLFPLAQKFFKIARGGKFLGRRGIIEKAFREGDVANLLLFLVSYNNPGYVGRNLERIVRLAGDNIDSLNGLFSYSLPNLSSKMLLSLYEHFLNSKKKEEK